MSTNTNGGTESSLLNTVQAKDDYYAAYEDETKYFDVLSNDLGGNAKLLWSIDTTSDDGVTDLVTRDRVEISDYSEKGARIWITGDGKIGYDTTALDRLAKDEWVDDQFTYAIRLANGTLSWATVNVRLTGKNDAPVAVNDSGAGSEDTSISGSVATNDSDVDNGAVLTYEVVGTPPAGFTMGSNGGWTLDASDAAYQSLAQGASLPVTVTYKVTDQHGESSTATLTVTVTGVNDAPVAGDDTKTGAEDSSISGTVATNDSDVDDGAVLSYAVVGTPPAGFTMGTNGAWTLDASNAAYQHLAQGASTDVVVSYTVTDQHGATDTATLTITVTGVNDAPVAGDDTKSGAEDSSISGTVATNDSDVDDGAVLSYAVVGTPPAGFTMGANGAWTLDASNAAYQHLAQGASTDVVVSYTVTDQHGTSDTATLTITVTGVNDAPVLTGTAATLAAGSEDVAYVVSAASLLAGFTDAEGNAMAVFGLTADHGSVTDNGDGTYTITPALNYFGPVMLSYSVIDGNGGSTPATLSFNLAAVNDAATFSGLDYQYVGENDSVNTVGGNLNSTDVDGTDDAFQPVVSGVSDKGWGTFTIDAAGNWTYTLDNSNPEVDALGPVDAADSFTVYAADGTPKVINIGIAGNNDAAVISGVTSGTVTEATATNAGTPTATGTLTATDVDNPPNTFIAAASTPTASGYGSFTMSAGGVWTYTLNNANPVVNALAAGMFLIDTFTVRSADGTTQTISVTINGANDVIVVTPPSTFTGSGDPNDFDTLGASTTNNAATITGTDSANTITGGDANQTINTLGGNDNAFGRGGDDIIRGGDGNDNLYGQAGNDQLFGEGGVDELYGGTGSDRLEGGANNDLKLYGGSGDDIILGGENNDTLFGGFGSDTLTGGAGSDTFVYLDLKDTNDFITDFVLGTDRIDLSMLDANSAMTGDQAFGWGGNTPTANSLWFEQQGTSTVIFGDTDGNAATAEFMITLQNMGSGFTPYSDPLNVPPNFTM